MESKYRFSILSEFKGKKNRGSPGSVAWHLDLRPLEDCSCSVIVASSRQDSFGRKVDCLKVLCFKRSDKHVACYWSYSQATGSNIPTAGVGTYSLGALSQKPLPILDFENTRNNFCYTQIKIKLEVYPLAPVI